jgi:hypothetical protein
MSQAVMNRRILDMSNLDFVQTSRGVSVEADCTQQYVTQLAREGLIPHKVASDGTRLYSQEAPSLVRQIKAERLAGRGRRSA